MKRQPINRIKGTVYLLHLLHGISRAQHYLGWAGDLTNRIEEHSKGKGAKLTQEAVRRGIAFEVVRTWEGTRQKERNLKNLKNSRGLCPHCREARKDSQRFYREMKKLGVRRKNWN